MHPGAVGSCEQSGGAHDSGGEGRVHPLGSALQPFGVHVTSPLASFDALSSQYSFDASHVAEPQLAPPELPLDPLDVPGPLVPLDPELLLEL